MDWVSLYVDERRRWAAEQETIASEHALTGGIALETPPVGDPDGPFAAMLPPDRVRLAAVAESERRAGVDAAVVRALRFT